MARRFRVWRLLPPRIARGACSTRRTRAPASRAVIAAQSAALPPPITSTSYGRDRSTIRRASRIDRADGEGARASRDILVRRAPPCQGAAREAPEQLLFLAAPPQERPQP